MVLKRQRGANFFTSPIKDNDDLTIATDFVYNNKKYNNTKLSEKIDDNL